MVDPASERHRPHHVTLAFQAAGVLLTLYLWYSIYAHFQPTLARQHPGQFETALFDLAQFVSLAGAFLVAALFSSLTSGSRSTGAISLMMSCCVIGLCGSTMSAGTTGPWLGMLIRLSMVISLGLFLVQHHRFSGRSSSPSSERHLARGESVFMIAAAAFCVSIWSCLASSVSSLWPEILAADFESAIATIVLGLAFSATGTALVFVTVLKKNPSSWHSKAVFAGAWWLATCATTAVACHQPVSRVVVTCIAIVPLFVALAWTYAQDLRSRFACLLFSACLVPTIWVGYWSLSRIIVQAGNLLVPNLGGGLPETLFVVGQVVVYAISAALIPVVTTEAKKHLNHLSAHSKQETSSPSGV